MKLKIRNFAGRDKQSSSVTHMENNSAKLLIVEDHHEMLQVMSKYLKEQGFKVVGAESGEAALEKFSEFVPDIVLMDIMLPGMSGIEATRKIRRINDIDSYIPILMITAKNEVEDVVTGLESGADDYIVKPFNFQELVARINSAIRIKKLNDMLRSQSRELEHANEQISGLNESLISKNKELRKKIFDLHNLFDISWELHSILDIHRLINSTLLTLVGQFSCRSAMFIYNYERAEHTLTVVNSKGLFKSDIEDIRIAKSDPLVEYLFKKHRPMVMEDIPAEYHDSKCYQQLSKVPVALISPVIVNQREIALLCLGVRVKNKAYDVNEMEILSTINNIVSIAISNAALYEEVTQLSYTDGLTGLHNYRYFEMRLKEEVVRYKRNEQNVSLIILDVDYFKNYNDTLGHQAGDEVLRDLGKILRQTVRENDIAARYGGEEFAVVLPGIGPKGVRILAERIRKNIEEYYFPNEEVQPSGKVTVSIGIATLPMDADSVTDLIHKADTALYKAKNQGRNRVVTYSEITD